MVTVGAVIFKLSGTLSRLQSTLDTLNKILEEFKTINNNEHQAFADKLFELEKRLHTLECKMT